MKKKSIVAFVIVSCVSSIVLGSTVAQFYTNEENSKLGISVIVDSKTGVNYIKTKDGGICVRVDANGRPVVER